MSKQCKRKLHAPAPGQERFAPLLEAQRVDGVQPCCAVSRVIPKADADPRANDQPGQRPAERKDEIGLEPHRQQIPADDAEDDSDDSAGFRYENRLGQELSKDIAAPRADRLADTDFLRPLRYAHEHNIHDPDASRDQRDQTDNESPDPHHAGDSRKSALERIVGVEFKIVFLFRAKPPGDPHGSHAFVQSGVIRFLRERLRRDIHRAVRFPEIFEKSRDRHHANIVLVLTESRPFFAEGADDRKVVSVESYRLANWCFVRKQTLLNHLADDDDAPRKVNVFIVDISAIGERV